MKKLWKSACALVLFLSCALAATPGCVDAEAPFFIIAAKAPSCDETSVDSTELGRGRLDLAYQCDYGQFLLLGNQLIRRGDDAKLQIETSRISVTRFDVELLDAAENPITRTNGDPVQFTYPTTGFVDAARASQLGEGLAYTQLIDGNAAAALQARVNAEGTVLVLARVVGHGRTLGGDDVKTRPWDFPIDVVYDQICFCSGEDDSATSCLITQDFSFHCSLTGNQCTPGSCVSSP